MAPEQDSKRQSVFFEAVDRIKRMYPGRVRYYIVDKKERREGGSRVE